MKPKHSIQILVLALLTLLTINAYAISPEEVARRVLEREDGETEVSRVQLLSCRYLVQNRSLSCADTPRIKEMDGIRKDYGPRGQDSKTITFIQEPVGERGIGFLQYDYDHQDKEADQWMYLSALGKVKRIVSGNENEPKTGSFFGTEFNYEDMEARHLKDYVYTISAEKSYQGRDCWVLESIPIPARLNKSNYSKTLDWVDKEHYMVLKRLLFDRKGKLVKTITFNRLEKVDGIWTTRHRLIRNLQTQRMTQLTFKKTAFNVPVDDQFLSLRTLTDRAFRERHLSEFGKAFK